MNGIAYLGTDVDSRVAIDSSLITAAIDVLHSSEFIGIVAIICRNGIAIFTLYHVDVHGWVGIHGSAGTQTATEHLADVSAGNDVQHRLIVWCCMITGNGSMRIVGRSPGRVFGSAIGKCSIFIVTEDRVGCLIATEVELVNLDRITSGLFDVDLYVSLDDTTEVVTAEDLTEGSTGDGELHIAIYIGVVGTAEYQVGLLVCRHTAHYQYDVAIDIGILACTYNLFDIQVTSNFAFLYVEVDIALNNTLLVAGSVCLMDITAIERGVGITRAIFSVVDKTDVGTRIGIPCSSSVARVSVFTVTTAEDIAYLLCT